MNEFYDELMGYLKKKTPKAQSPEGLTEKIMQAVQKNHRPNLPYISLVANEKQWYLYRAIRVITTVAAAFLIVFLISEQWEMKRKMNQLENEMISGKLLEDFNKYPSRSEKIQQVFYECTGNAETVDQEMDPGEAIRINRKSLNFLLNKIQELEKENLNYRIKFQQTYSDSTQIIQK